MNNPRISLVHPTSNPFSRNAARSLAEANLLQEIITTTAYHPNGKLARWLKQLPPQLSQILTQELARRTWIPPDNVPLRDHPWQETLRIALVKSGLSRPLGFGRTGPINWVYASLDRHVAKYHLQGLDAVYAYEDGAATTFQVAKQQNILCLYDLPIPFYRTSQAIQAEEAQRFPELASAFQAVQEPAWKIKRKEQEIQLADHIFVASSFTKKSLLDIGINQEKISVIPYGSPLEYFQPQPKPDNLFRALFVGRVGPRKGVHYLLQSWQDLQLAKAELLLVGINEFPHQWLSQYEDSFRYVSTVPHGLLNQYYSAANVLVFPSLVEGFGLVILEAMTCGIPVITTPNTAGADIITDGKDGFIVPIRDVEALKEKIAWCYNRPQELAEMGKAARRKAEELTWDLYRHKLGNKVKEVINHSTKN